MRKKSLLLMGIFSLGLLNAQVGINTRSPQGVFHIDAGVIGTTSDDVDITGAGNMGIGTITPQAKLELVSPTPGAIRIVDTSEGMGKVLTSSVTGEGSWSSIIGSWNASLRGGNLPYTTSTGRRKINFTEGTISNPSLGWVDVSNASIKVPYTGSYRLTVFGTSLMNRVVSGYFIAGFYIIRKNGGQLWVPHSLGSTLISTSPYVSYYSVVYLNQNDVLDIVEVEDVPYANAVADLTFFVEFIK